MVGSHRSAQNKSLKGTSKGILATARYHETMSAGIPRLLKRANLGVVQKCLEAPEISGLVCFGFGNASWLVIEPSAKVFTNFLHNCFMPLACWYKNYLLLVIVTIGGSSMSISGRGNCWRNSKSFFACAAYMDTKVSLYNCNEILVSVKGLQLETKIYRPARKMAVDTHTDLCENLSPPMQKACEWTRVRRYWSY